MSNGGQLSALCRALMNSHLLTTSAWILRSSLLWQMNSLCDIVTTSTGSRHILSPSYLRWMGYISRLALWFCSVQFRNLRDFEIEQRILRIRKLRTNLKIEQYVCTISRLCNPRTFDPKHAVDSSRDGEPFQALVRRDS